MKNGLTFIELLITLTIIGILITLSYPTYLNYMMRIRRIDAQTALLDLANHLEQYYSENHTYSFAKQVFSPKPSPEKEYMISIKQVTSDAYTLQATPIHSQSHDLLCQSFTLNSMGTKGIAEGPLGLPTGTVHQCWG